MTLQHHNMTTWPQMVPPIDLSPFPGSLSHLGASRGLRSQESCTYKRGLGHILTFPHPLANPVKFCWSMFLLLVWQHCNMTRQAEWQAFTLVGRSPKVLICSIIFLSTSRLSIIGELIKAKRKLWEMNLLLDAGVTSIPEHKRCEGSLVPLRDCGENVHQKPNKLEFSCLSSFIPT